MTSIIDGLTQQEEERLLAKGQVKGGWLNYATSWERADNGQMVRPETIYVDANITPGWAPENAAFDIPTFKRGMSAFKSGATNDPGKFTEDPWLGDWAKINAARVLSLNPNASQTSLKSAGIGMTGDFSGIDIVNVMAEMVNTELRDFVLEQAVTTVATPNLLLSIDTYTRFTGQKSIAEATPPTLKLGSVSRTSYDLVKDGTAIGLSFEAQARAVHDIYRTHVDNAISDLRRIKANKIAVEIETAADVASADWAAFTTDHNTTNPYDAIGTVSDTIVSNNGRANVIASADRVFRDFVASTYVKGWGDNAAHTSQFSTARVITGITGLEGFTWYIDNEKTATIASVYDKSAIIKMQGPVRTAVVRDEMADTDMYRIFDFNLPKLIIAGRARDLTSVSA